MNRLSKRMRDNQASGKTSLVVYITHGDPSPKETVAIVEAAAKAGADVVELGVPFSDPNADGVVIQKAMERARLAGGGLQNAIDAVREVRRRECEVPIVLFGYYNPIFVYGVERFAKAAAEAGIDAVLTVDLPLDEMAELYEPLSQENVGIIPLVAPTSGMDRITPLKKYQPPFVYYISMTGVTGSAMAKASVGPRRVAEVREATDAPIAVGFGIKTPDDAARIAAYSDGVVVGSAIVQRIMDAEKGKAPDAVYEFVSSLREGCDRS